MNALPFGRRMRAGLSERWLAMYAVVAPAPEQSPPSALAAVNGSLATSGKRLRQWLATGRGQRRLAWVVVVLLIAIDILVVGQHVLVRHFAYHSDAFDLGNMDQAVWNTLHGQWFRFTNRGIDWYGPPTRLGIHVEPILLLIAPLYLIHSGPETLLALQTVALALGALPLMALSLRRLPSAPVLGVAFVVAYLLAPELLGQALWDFHPVALATPLLLAAIYALDGRRYGWFLVAGLVAAACKEDVALALVPMGALIAIREGHKRFGTAVMVGAVAWTALCFVVIIPHFNDGASSGGNAYWYRYTSLGATPGLAVKHIATNPLVVLSVIATPDKLGYLAALLRTGGGLGVFMPAWWLVGLPELAINLLSEQPAQYSGFYHYNAVLLPAIFAGAIYGIAALRAARLAALAGRDPWRVTASPQTPAWYLQRIGRRWLGLLGRVPIAPRLMVPVMVGWLLMATGWNLVAISYKLGGFWAAGAGPTPHQAQIDALLRRIPAHAVVAATDTLDPHLTDRETIYLMPDPLSYEAQYVAVDLTVVNPAWQADDVHMYATMIRSGHYRVVGTAGPVVVLQRIGPALSGG